MPESRFSIVEQMGVVVLQWNSIPMDRVYDRFYKKFKESPFNLPNNLIYIFEGKHHAYPTRVVLYIGKTEAEKNDKRPCDSAIARIYGKPKIMACTYCDMTLRWAIIPDIPKVEEEWDISEKMTPVKILEQILIHAMKPALNSSYADGYLPDNPCFRKVGCMQ